MIYTVYFDTSFYVRLQRSLKHNKVDEAIKLVDALRERKIRRVESVELVLELAAGTDHAGKQCLIDLLLRWESEPCRIGGANLAWICADNQFDIMEAIMHERAAMFALSAHARRPLPKPAGQMSPEDHEKALTLSAKMAEHVASHPFLPEFAKSYFLELKGLVETGLNLEAVKDLMGRLQRSIAEEMPGFSFAEDVRKEILASNVRPTLIVEKRASAEAERNHRATIVDLDHLSVFQQNLDSIDWLMMDGPQLAALDQRAKLQISPFRHRIFLAPSLDHVIPALDALIGGERVPGSGPSTAG